MFQDLDTTLANLFSDPAAGALVQNATKSFETPEKNFKPQKLALNLFLHEVKENRELRDPQPTVVRQGNAFVRFLPPIRVMCSYMVTAWGVSTGSQRVVDEHQLLGEAFRWVCRFNTIPAGYLAAGFATQEFPPPTMVASMDGNKVFGEFWTALNQPPRPAFLIAVTIAADIAQPQQGYQVLTRQLDTQPGPLRYAGVVMAMTAAGQVPVINANVALTDVGLTTVSFDGGQFLFQAVPPGDHQLEIVAPNMQALRQTVQVPSASANQAFVLYPT